MSPLPTQAFQFTNLKVVGMACKTLVGGLLYVIEGRSFPLPLVGSFFFFLNFNLLIYLFIFGYVGSSFLCEGFL